MMRYEFDVRLFSVVTVDAQDEGAARKALAAMLARAALSVAPEVDGSPLAFSVAPEGEADLNDVIELTGGRA